MRTKNKGIDEEISGLSGLSEDTEILLADGTAKRIGDVNAGDLVLGPGGACLVRTVIQNKVPTFRVDINRGQSFEVSENHKICCAFHTYKNTFDFLDITPNEYIAYSEYRQKRTFLLRSRCVRFDRYDELPIHPYIIGYLLGRGVLNKRYLYMSIKDPKVAEYMSMLFRMEGLSLCRYSKTSNKHYISGDSETLDAFCKTLYDLGLFKASSRAKFIPDVYKFASKQERRFLISGLLVASSAVLIEKNTFCFSDNSERLVEDVRFVCMSLGMRVNMPRMNQTRGASYYTIRIATSDILPMLYSKNAVGTIPYPHSSIEGINVIPIEDKVCVELDVEGGCYIDSQFFMHK